MGKKESDLLARKKYEFPILILSRCMHVQMLIIMLQQDS